MNKEDIKIDVQSIIQDAEATYDMKKISEILGKEDAESFEMLVKAVAELEAEGRIHLNDDGTLSLISRNDEYEGVFSATSRGFGFVRVEGFDADLFIPPAATLNAMNRDKVKVKVTKEARPWDGKGPEGEIIEILERGTVNVVGEFHAYSEDQVKSDELYGYVTLTDKKLENYVVYILDYGIRPQDHAMVQVTIKEYPTQEQPQALKGLVITELGHVKEPHIDVTSIVYKHELPVDFSEETLKEVEEIPDHVLDHEYEGRKDYRDAFTVTIDGESAKDLDDAISFEKLSNGNYRLGVHIADVAHYVRPGTALDEDAFERGTSVYLTDRVIPMLPEKLSNGICSINPGVDRLAITADMEIDKQGQVVQYDIQPSVIRSDRRMTYTEFNAIVEDEDPKTRERYQDQLDMFEGMVELHEVLTNMRERRGAISFETPEANIIVDEKGFPIDIVMVERRTAEMMIESFMLVANETVSEHFTKKEYPILYRVHEQPDPEKMQTFMEFIGKFGVHMNARPDEVRPKNMQGVTQAVDGEDYEEVVNIQLLRSMQKARYDTQPLGHFGLAAEYYSHFTAPIRRYPDTMLHRLIHFYAENGGNFNKQKLKTRLDEVAEHSSDTERRAIDTEREVVSMKKVEYMQDRVGEVFTAKISSVVNFGIFVQLENTVEGMIHISNMKEDYFEFHEDNLMMVGRHTGIQYRIGQEVEVKLVQANKEQGQLDFIFTQDEEKVKEDQEAQERNGNNRQNGRSDHRPHQNRGQNKNPRGGGGYGDQEKKNKYSKKSGQGKGRSRKKNQSYGNKRPASKSTSKNRNFTIKRKED